jgi:hypothetical protein
VNLHKKKIASTKTTPEITLNPEGHIKIKGRSMDANVTGFSVQAEKWIDEYICDPSDSTSIDIYLEYLNTNHLKFYISLLKKIDAIKLKHKKYLINWYYDEGDEDIIEKGEYISTMLEVRFNFIMISDKNDI